MSSFSFKYELFDRKDTGGPFIIWPMAKVNLRVTELWVKNNDTCYSLHFLNVKGSEMNYKKQFFTKPIFKPNNEIGQENVNNLWRQLENFAWQLFPCDLETIVQVKCKQPPKLVVIKEHTSLLGFANFLSTPLDESSSNWKWTSKLSLLSYSWSSWLLRQQGSSRWSIDVPITSWWGPSVTQVCQLWESAIWLDTERRSISISQTVGQVDFGVTTHLEQLSSKLPPTKLTTWTITTSVSSMDTTLLWSSGLSEAVVPNVDNITAGARANVMATKNGTMIEGEK